ncbi:MAG: hypothetical protein FJZ90_07725 [Chloroflexi bacterium]|nr:hypothetical protein [Chloroflexota bacterium]
MSRITVELLEDELEALARLAEQEHRPTRMQAAYELRKALVTRGLLPEPDRQEGDDEQQR